MGILRQELAPISTEAWRVIEDEARDMLCTHLSARTIVDVTEPGGWTKAAVNTGVLEIQENEIVDGVTWGVRKALPLIEVRVPFEVQQQEVDNISRGATGTNLDSLSHAANVTAAFEERVIYHGSADVGIPGILGGACKTGVTPAPSPEAIVHSTAEAVKALQDTGVAGPYNLVLPASMYYQLPETTDTGVRVTRVLHDLLGGSLRWSPGVQKGFVISSRGRDFELALGQDLSIGYASHDRDKIELYFTESFTFRVLDADAAVVFDLS